MAPVKIATWNVNGVRARESQLQQFIDRERPDILCLQEIKATVDQLPMWMCDVEGYHCYWHGGRAYSGVALHIEASLAASRPEFWHPPFDYETRIVAARLPAFTVASVYVPNGGKDFPAKLAFLEQLDAFAADFASRGESLVLCGDMNVALTDLDVHPKERKPSVIGQRPDERALMERILSRGLVDVHRRVEPGNAELFTWWAPWRNLRARNIGWRLDLILASRAIADRLTSCVVQREFGSSDHGPVIAEFAL